MGKRGPVPAILISGFLGSGKTTLLNELVPRLRRRGDRVAVLVNELGQAAVDALLVKERDYLAEVTGGSLYCACVRGDLVRAMKRITQETDADTLVVEATGVADPAELGGFGDHPELAGLYRLAFTVCVASASRLYKVVRTLAAVRRQLALADLVVVTGSDSAPPADLQHTIDAVHHFGGDVPCLVAPYARLPEATWQAILDSTRLLPTDGAVTNRTGVGATADAPLERAQSLYQTRLLPVPALASEDALRRLQALLPEDTERAKGLVVVDGEARVFQFTAGVATLQQAPGDGEAAGWVVAIGRYPVRLGLDASSDCVR